MKRRNGIRNALLATVTALGTALGLGVAPATAGTESASWGQLPVPSPGTLESLAGIGGDTVFGQTLVNCGWPTDPRQCRQQWRLTNGTWSKFSVPVALGSRSLVTAGTGTNDLWLLEGPYNSSGLAHHWNGQKWTDRSQPDKAFRSTAIATVSPTDVWTVGAYNTGYAKRDDRATVGHWNGTRWTVTKLPTIAGKSTDLRSVSASSANDVWAAGEQCTLTGAYLCQPYVAHWNGTAWSQVNVPEVTPTNGLWTKVISRGGKVWVGGKETGASGEKSDRIFTLHRDGQNWTKSYLPVNAAEDGYFGYLNGFAFHGTELFAGVSHTKNEGLSRWNGQGWEQYAGPLATTSTVTSLAGTGDGRLFVAGNGTDASGTHDFVSVLPAAAPSAG
ncbi:hypothetical protein [Streptomyces sp. NPDC054863]